MSVATRAKPESSIKIYTAERELVCYVYLCHHPLHLSKLLNQSPFIGPCHCSYIFIPCLAFCIVAATVQRHPEPTKESRTYDPWHNSKRFPTQLGSLCIVATNSILYVVQSRRHSVHVAGDLNQKLSFVVGVLMTSFAHALLSLIS